MKPAFTMDGGGNYALAALQGLKVIERELGAPLCQHFSLMVGTSAGAIVAAALARGMTCTEVEGHMKRLQGRVFAKPRPRLLRGFKAKYSSAPLREALRDVFGAHTLQSNSKAPLMIVAYRVESKQDAGGPVFFKSWKDKHRGLRVVDALQASASAPTYFKPHQITHGGITAQYVDGGVTSNSPALEALAELLRAAREHQAQNPGAVFTPPRILSIGTGRARRGAGNRFTRRGSGLFRWAASVVGLLMDGASESRDYILTELCRAGYVQAVRLQVNLPRKRLDETRMHVLEQAGQAFHMSARRQMPEILKLFEE